MAKKNRQQFAAQRAKQARQRRIIYLGIGLVAALVVAGLGVFFWMPGSATGSGNTSTTTDTGAAATCSDIQSIPDEGNAHLTAGQTPTYRSNPPSSGTHNPVPLAAGIYDQPVDVTMEVHSQEHGYIIMHYNGISQNEIDQLKQMVTNDPRKMILSPYPNMSYKVSLTAWDHQQTCTGVNRQAISNFVAEFRDRGPENVP